MSLTIFSHSFMKIETSIIQHITYLKGLFILLIRIYPPSQLTLQPFRPVQLAPHHWLRWEQRVGQEEPSSVPDALQKLAGCQAGPAGQRGAPGSHASQLQQHTHRTEAGETGELEQQTSKITIQIV